MSFMDELGGWKDWVGSMTEQIKRTFLITTTNREYDGKVYTSVKRIQPNDEVPF
jgi:hypothetical protein